MLDCPKCSSDMQSVTFDGITVDRCTQCQGIWFDALELEAILERRPGRAIDLGDPNVEAKLNAMKRVPCPHCTGPMVRLVSDRHPEVKYEQCAVCGGAYLDAGELRVLEKRSIVEMLTDLSPRFLGSTDATSEPRRGER